MKANVYAPRPAGRLNPWHTWRRLLALAGDRAPALRRSVVQLLAAALCQGGALAAVVPLFDALLATRDGWLALGWLMLSSVALLAAVVLRWRAFRFDFEGDMIAVTQALRTALGRKLRSMPLHRLRDDSAGGLIHTVFTNVETAFAYLFGVLNALFLAVCMPLAAALFLLGYDWRLGGLLLLLFPLVFAFYVWRRPAFGRSTRTVDAAHRRLYANVMEAIQGLGVLRSAHRLGERALYLQHDFDALEAEQRRDARGSASPDLAMASAIELSMLAVLGVGGALFASGQIGLAVLAALLVVCQRFGEPLSNLVLYTYLFDMIETALVRIEALLAEPDLPMRQPPAMPEGGEVRFDNVHFHYPGAAQACLHGVSLRFPANALTAIVGPSGAGKSTLIKLLQREADPARGVIRIGGADIRHVPVATLSAMIAVVFQDVYLFDDTVFNNIAMARPDASRDDVEAAARLAHCEAFIQRLPQGYDTRIGEIGDRLSGGERQRLSIARALLKDAPIVVLDEPTASLDADSEAQVQAALDRLVRGKTVIVISHRLSTIRGADQIVTLDDGRVAEVGTHRDLMARRGRYYRLQAAMCHGVEPADEGAVAPWRRRRPVSLPCRAMAVPRGPCRCRSSAGGG